MHVHRRTHNSTVRTVPGVEADLLKAQGLQHYAMCTGFKAGLLEQVVRESVRLHIGYALSIT